MKKKKMRPAWILALVLLAVLPVRADRLFTSGFEENNLTATMWTTTSATPPSIVTSPVHAGTYAVEFDTILSVARVVRKTLAVAKTSGTLFTRFYWRYTAVINIIQRNLSSGSSGSLEVRVFDSGDNKRIRLRNAITTTEADSTFNLSTNTWYRFEVRHLISDTVGEMEVRVYLGDSTTLLFPALSITGEDTNPGNIQQIGFGSPGSGGTYSFHMDDIAINDEVGAAPFNTFSGPGKIFLLKPSGDNTVTWTKAGSTPAATNFEGVDDLPGTPNDGVDYNESTTNQTDKLDLSNLGAEVTSDADIILADVYGRIGSNGTTGTRTIDFELWDEADSQNTLLDVSIDINGWRICDTDEHLVFDVGTRTKANVDSFRVGYSRSQGGANPSRITAQWVNVEWIEAAAGADDDLMVIQ